jgi:hypothetical protein
MNKPPFLYHASPTLGLKTLSPSFTKKQMLGKPQGLYAGHSLIYVSAFLLRGHSSTVRYGFIDEKYRYIALNKDLYPVEKFSQPAAMYEFPSDNFEPMDHAENTPKQQWVTFGDVTITKEIIVEKPLDFMIDNGTVVYLLDNTSFEAVYGADGSQYEGADQRLKQFISENEKRGLTPLPIVLP